MKFSQRVIVASLVTCMALPLLAVRSGHSAVHQAKAKANNLAWWLEDGTYNVVKRTGSFNQTLFLIYAGLITSMKIRGKMVLRYGVKPYPWHALATQVEWIEISIANWVI